jgi:hypothetical protein
MSRGLGKLQRDLLAILEENDKSIDTITLTALAYQDNPEAVVYEDRVTDAQHATVRRALRNLHKRGLVVDLTRHTRDGRRYWASLKSRRPPLLGVAQGRTTRPTAQSSAHQLDERCVQERNAGRSRSRSQGDGNGRDPGAHETTRPVIRQAVSLSFRNRKDAVTG